MSRFILSFLCVSIIMIAAPACVQNPEKEEQKANNESKVDSPARRAGDRASSEKAPAGDGDAKAQGDLLTAAAAGDMARVIALLDGDADLNKRDESGRTPLMLAAMNGQVDIVRVLIAQRADVNARDEQGHTALSHAALKGHEAIVEFLKAAGASQ